MTGLQTFVVAVMAGGGAAILLLACRGWSRLPAVSGRATVAVSGALGLSVLGYAALLALAQSGAGPTVQTAAAGGHTVPLTLIQILPLMASGVVLGRRVRWWVLGIVTIVLLSTACVVGTLVMPATGATARLAMLSGVLWFAIFPLGPVLTWWWLRGRGGERRRRGVAAALSALLPIVVIGWCMAVTPFTAALGWGEAAGVALLLIAFTAGAVSCAALALTAIAADGSPGLRTGRLVATLDAVVGVGILVLASAGVAAAARLGPIWTLVVTSAATVAIVLGWRRLHGWVQRIVDPLTELRHELTTLGASSRGQARATALHALRRVADDPELTIEVGRPDATESHTTGIVLASDGDGRPVFLAHPRTPHGRRRTLELGDCSQLLSPAVLEAEVELSARRAEIAAESEGRRLRQDLHDGLQARLLGLALSLQLTGRESADPGTRLVLGGTVEGLRSAVEDVRALAGGRLPDLLVREGLASALSVLVRPVAGVVHLDLPTRRLGVSTEATAYFVIGEGISNALKHAMAEAISVKVSAPGAGRVTVVVQDDGRGGADPRLGTGLRALAERVHAQGGILLVRDGPAGGTVLEAELPCGS